jgi:hypothetical protein
MTSVLAQQLTLSGVGHLAERKKTTDKSIERREFLKALGVGTAVLTASSCGLLFTSLVGGDETRAGINSSAQL